MTEKRDKSIKARQCTNGRKQKEYIPKESALLTVSNESIFIMCTIEAKERRSVVVVDLLEHFYMP